jgi:uncharacterized membrane protein
MRQWRVGTISMGVLLIVVGFVCFLANLTGNFMLIRTVLNLWPTVLILLGIEVLTYSFFLKVDSPRIRYDGFSIFIIMLILFLSCGAYIFQSLVNSGHINWFINL